MLQVNEKQCLTFSVRKESGTQVPGMTDEKQDVCQRHHAGIMQVGRTRGKNLQVILVHGLHQIEIEGVQLLFCWVHK